MRWARLTTPSLFVGLVALGVLATPGGLAGLRPAIPFLKGAVAAACCGLLLLERVASARGWGKLGARSTRDGLLIALALASVLLWTHLGSTLRLESFHRWEFFNHFVGGKYFQELGYTRLYDCVTVADDLADDPGISLSDRLVRRLSTNVVARGTVVLEQSRDCPELFTPERWQSFQNDVAFFRANLTPERWRLLQTDHGMNASPAWLMISSPLANTGPATLSHIRWILWLDFLILLAIGGVAAWAFGWRVVCVACVYFGTLAPGDIEWIGRSFIRYDWLLAAVAGLALLKRGHHAASGALLTFGALLRVIPGFLIAGLMLTVGVGLVRARSPRIPARWWRFAAGSVATLALVVPLSALSTGGFDSWLGFAQNSRLQLESPLLNFMGWPVVVGYEHASRLALTRDVALPGAHNRWQVHRLEVRERRASLYWLGVVVFTALLAWAARQNDDWVMGVLGAGALVMMAGVGAYYYVLLLVFAFLLPRRPEVAIGLCGLSLVSRLIDAGFEEIDEVYTWTSLASVIYVLGVTAAMAWPARGGGAKPRTPALQ